MWSAVSPLLDWTLTLAPLSTRKRTTASCPFLDAETYNGFTSTPRCRNVQWLHVHSMMQERTMASRPLHDAETYNGFMSIPRCTNVQWLHVHSTMQKSTMASCPFSDAVCSAVLPLLDWTLTLAPLSTSKRTIASHPFLDAVCSVVLPLLHWTSMLAPLPIRNLTMSACPPWHACISGVHRMESCELILWFCCKSHPATSKRPVADVMCSPVWPWIW